MAQRQELDGISAQLEELGARTLGLGLGSIG